MSGSQAAGGCLPAKLQGDAWHIGRGIYLMEEGKEVDMGFVGTLFLGLAGLAALPGLLLLAVSFLAGLANDEDGAGCAAMGAAFLLAAGLLAATGMALA